MRLTAYLSALVALALAPALATAQVTFTDVASGDLLDPIRSWGASFVDVDGDGDPDLFLSRFAAEGGNALFRNDGGTFTAVDAGPLTTGPGSLGHSWGDVDNDDDLDVLLVGGTGNSQGFGNTGSGIRLMLNDGDGSSFSEPLTPPFTPVDGIEGWTGAWADFDLDGLLDFVVAHPEGFVSVPDQTNALYRQTTSVSMFESVPNSPVTDDFDTYTVPTWSDYDLDGDPDLFIGSGPANGSVDEDNLYRNDGGTFIPITEGIIATDERDGQVMNWQDVDNDGDLDLFVTNFNRGPDDLYFNNGDGTFTADTSDPLATDDTGNSLGNTWGDLDNDGDLDVFVSTGGNPGTDRLYLNDGDGNFTLEQSFSNGATSGATLGDYDGDGDLDLAVTSQQFPSGGPIQLYENQTDNDNAWVKLRLIGRESNRAAIGARVEVTASIGGELVTQLREVSAQNTFNGHNDLTVHVGLGDATAINEIRVIWPSGTEDARGDFAVGTTHVLTEGFSTDIEGSIEGSGFRLGTPFPNPSAEGVALVVDLDEPTVLEAAVFDLRGRRVASLARGFAAAEERVLRWDGRDETGTPAAAGVYVVRVQTERGVLDRRVTLVR